MKKELIIEIGVEEIPAQYVKTMAESYKTNAIKMLNELKLEFEDIKVLWTPRRLSLCVKNLVDKQEDEKLLVKGPSVKVAFEQDGKTPTRALAGFLAKNNKSVEDIITNGDYVCLDYVKEGSKAVDVLPSAIQKLILSIYNPNPMRWNSFKMKFIRPIRWILALLDSEVIPVELECVKSSSYTYGHRTLCNRQLLVSSAKDYQKVLENGFVILNQDDRKNLILNQIKLLEKENNFTVEVDESILDEITNIVEYPTCAVGYFEEKYLSLPECVIKCPLKEQQRYFAVYKDGSISNTFVFVRNGGKDFIENVIKGNERVLRPRLADAEFFMANDLKTTLKEKAKGLSNVVFVEKAGSYLVKNERTRKIASLLAKVLDYKEKENEIEITTSLMKADLVSNIVREYTSIQGQLGAIFAEKDGYSKQVALAIKEQYLPAYQGDNLPTSIFSSIISIADKLDNILSLCAVGLKPTSSSDPYGLRRQIIGIFLIALEQKFDLDFDKIIDNLASIYEPYYSKENESTTEFTSFVKEFFEQRLRIFLNEVKKYNATELAQISVKELNIYKSIKKLEMIRKISKTDWFNDFTSIFNRVLKLIKNFDCEKLAFTSGVVDREAEEMFNAFNENKSNILENIEKENYEKAIELIAKCGNKINEFMTKHLALCEDEKKKNNRIIFFNEFCKVCGLILTL